MSVSSELFSSLSWSIISSLSATCCLSPLQVLWSSSICFCMALSPSPFIAVFDLLSWSWCSTSDLHFEVSSRSSFIFVNRCVIKDISRSFSSAPCSALQSFEFKSEIFLLAVRISCFNFCFSSSASLTFICMSAMSFLVCNKSFSNSWISLLCCSCKSWISLYCSLRSWYFNSMSAALIFCSAMIASLLESSCLFNSKLDMFSAMLFLNALKSSCNFKNFPFSFWSCSVNFDLCVSPRLVLISILCTSSLVSLNFSSKALFSFSFLRSWKRASCACLLACCSCALLLPIPPVSLFPAHVSSSATLSSDSFSCKFNCCTCVWLL